MIKLGEYVKLKVKRKSDLGFMLTDGSDEVLLHFSQSLKEHEINDEVTVFIYSDKAKRLTATEIKPTVTLKDAGFCKVVDVIPGCGIFVNINTPKDVLISKDYLPYNESLWPIKDDTLYVRLKLKHDTFTAKPLNKYEIIELEKNVKYADYEIVDGIVISIVEKGIGVITKDLMYVFVPNHQLRGIYRLGESVNVKITKSLGDSYYGSLIKQKEEMIDPDKELIINYLKCNNNEMKLTAKSSAEEIETKLKISRKAFKRALGGLYKDRIVDCLEDKTILIKK